MLRMRNLVSIYPYWHYHDAIRTLNGIQGVNVMTAQTVARNAVEVIPFNALIGAEVSVLAAALASPDSHPRVRCGTPTHFINRA